MLMVSLFLYPTKSDLMRSTICVNLSPVALGQRKKMCRDSDVIGLRLNYLISVKIFWKSI